VHYAAAGGPNQVVGAALSINTQLSIGLTVSRPKRILKAMLDQSSVGRVFHALGDPTRRAIVEELCRTPKSAKDLAGPLHITLAAIVQHLQLLEESGLIRTTKIGRVRTCHIEPAGLQVAQHWIAKRRSLWERRLDRLGAVLATERK
jgi:DNA-binding transcriptional ArsR family regulator